MLLDGWTLGDDRSGGWDIRHLLQWSSSHFYFNNLLEGQRWVRGYGILRIPSHRGIWHNNLSKMTDGLMDCTDGDKPANLLEQHLSSTHS
jgi:hypothetical protein